MVQGRRESAGPTTAICGRCRAWGRRT
jgi:hypothetical protein